MTPSDGCLDLIKRSEGLKLSAYQDVAGVWTIGYGCTGAGIEAGVVWTQEEADNALADRVGIAGGQVSQLVKVPLTQGQFDALTDFVYNLGAGSLGESTLLRLLNAGQYTSVPDQLSRWVYAAGEVQPGLVTRRQAEIELWNGASA